MQTLIAPGRTLALVTGTTTTMGTVMTRERWWGELTWLTPEHVARIWTEERHALAEEQAQRRRGGRLTARETAPVQPSTVVSYLKESRPMVGAKKGRYADFPVPAPVPGRALIWVPGPGQTMDDLVEDLRTWWRERPMQTRGEHGEFAPKDEDANAETDPELLHRPGEQ